MENTQKKYYLNIILSAAALLIALLIKVIITFIVKNSSFSETLEVVIVMVFSILYVLLSFLPFCILFSAMQEKIYKNVFITALLIIIIGSVTGKLTIDNQFYFKGLFVTIGFVLIFIFVSLLVSSFTKHKLGAFFGMVFLMVIMYFFFHNILSDTDAKILAVIFPEIKITSSFNFYGLSTYIIYFIAFGIDYWILSLINNKLKDNLICEKNI